MDQHIELLAWEFDEEEQSQDLIDEFKPGMSSGEFQQLVVQYLSVDDELLDSDGVIKSLKDDQTIRIFNSKSDIFPVSVSTR